MRRLSFRVLLPFALVALAAGCGSSGSTSAATTVTASRGTATSAGAATTGVPTSDAPATTRKKIPAKATTTVAELPATTLTGARGIMAQILKVACADTNGNLTSSDQVYAAADRLYAGGHKDFDVHSGDGELYYLIHEFHSEHGTPQGNDVVSINPGTCASDPDALIAALPPYTP